MSNRISPSSPWLLWSVTVAVFALYVFGAIVSFAGLYAIAPWLLLPETLYWSFPLAVDVAILVYKAAEVILRNDTRKTHKIKKAVFGSVIFTFVSSAGNVVHVVNANDPNPLRFWGGLLFAGMIPWAVYLAASVLTDLIVDPLPQQDDVLERELQKVLSTEEREEQTAQPYTGWTGRFVKTQNLTPPPPEDDEAPPEDEPIRFLHSEDEVDAFGVNMQEKRHEEMTREMSARFPDLSVTRDVKLEPFPEAWGKKDGS